MINIWKLPWLGIPYSPRPEERSYLERIEVRQDDSLVVRASVLANWESEGFFGVPMARRGIQPLWLEITNQGTEWFRLRLASLDPNYFPPLEAALINHFRIGRRLMAFGVLAWLFLPFVILVPFKLIAAWKANRRMDEYFQEHGLGWGRLAPGDRISGFVFTSLDEGTKQFTVRLLGLSGTRDFAFSIPVPGLRVDYVHRPFEDLLASENTVECDEAKLRKRLIAMPRSTTNARGTVEGDPLNLAVIGEFDTLIQGFGARWDETEVITFQSCWRTFKAFLLGTSYRYSPVSALFWDRRCQDFALQRVRQTINQRLHLRLWLTPLRFQSQPVWIGQISRDIGVRFTYKTWNLTTHKVDPDVDDARDYLLDELLQTGRVALVGYVSGAEAAPRKSPRHNLTGDPYFTDGQRAVVMFSDTPTGPKYVNWV
jgi:hypothetical protein